MTITISSLMLNDLKCRIIKGSSPKRKAIFSISGTSAGTADTVDISSYITTLESIDSITSSNQNNTEIVYTFNTGTTNPVATTTYNWGTTFTTAGVIKPGTVGAFTVQGILTYV